MGLTGEALTARMKDKTFVMPAMLAIVSPKNLVPLGAVTLTESGVYKLVSDTRRMRMHMHPSRARVHSSCTRPACAAHRRVHFIQPIHPDNYAYEPPPVSCTHNPLLCAFLSSSLLLRHAGCRVTCRSVY